MAAMLPRMYHLYAGEHSRVRFPAEARGFSPLEPVETTSGAHPASYSDGTGVLDSEVKRPGREADHSPPSNAEFCSRLDRYSLPQSKRDCMLSCALVPLRQVCCGTGQFAVATQTLMLCWREQSVHTTGNTRVVHPYVCDVT